MSVADHGNTATYALFVDVAPRLLKREVDSEAVSLLGQTVSDVVFASNRTNDETALLKVIADLESARSNALVENINQEWALPLAALLGVLRQLLHNRTVEAASLNPNSVTLRDKVLTAIQAGVDNPTAISKFVESPPTVVSRTIGQLAKEGRVKRVDSESTDRRVRRFAAVARDQDLGDPPQLQPASPALADPNSVIASAERQAQLNPLEAIRFLPDLHRLGAIRDLPTDRRISALAVAGVITRAAGGAGARTDALDIAEAIEQLADETPDRLLVSRALYERVRAGLYATNQPPQSYLSDLEIAEKYLEDRQDREAQIRRGWCEYTRAIILDRMASDAMITHVERACELFGDAGFAYGEAASFCILARSLYAVSDHKGAQGAVDRATTLAYSKGFLRCMAESSFWTGELLAPKKPEQAEYCFKVAAELFDAVGTSTWSALSAASRVLASAESGSDALNARQARKLLKEFRQISKKLDHGQGDADAASQSWAVAVFARRFGVVARLAGDKEAAKESFQKAIDIYSSHSHLRGETAALAGLSATENDHSSIQAVDAKVAVAAAKERQTPDTQAERAAAEVTRQLRRKPSRELAAL